MRTTLDIPDALYREVRSKSALEGVTLRAITITLYTDWLARKSEPKRTETESSEETLPPWAGLCAQAITRNAEGPHDMESIRKSIVQAHDGVVQ